MFSPLSQIIRANELLLTKIFIIEPIEIIQRTKFQQVKRKKEPPNFMQLSARKYARIFKVKPKFPNS